LHRTIVSSIPSGDRTHNICEGVVYKERGEARNLILNLLNFAEYLSRMFWMSAAFSTSNECSDPSPWSPNPPEVPLPVAWREQFIFQALEYALLVVVACFLAMVS